MTNQIEWQGRAISKQDVIDMVDREINYLSGKAYTVGTSHEEKAVIWDKVNEYKEALEELVWEDE